MLQIGVFLCVPKIACMEFASRLTHAIVKQDMVALLAAFVSNANHAKLLTKRDKYGEHYLLWAPSLSFK
jgi:hypothetical protein